MNIHSFDDLLTASRAQADAQTLLMVFVDAQLPETASAAERERFAQGQGGSLSPRMCLARSASELQDWSDLVREADQQSSQWRMVLVAALAGSAEQLPPDSLIDPALDRMVMAVHQGQIQGLLALDRQGQALQIHPA